MRTLVYSALVLSLAVFSGCEEETRGSGNADDGKTAANESGEGDDGIAEADDEGGTRLDIEGGEGASAGDNVGCRKVDFLFVIDNSGSMSEEHEALVNSFPGFIDTIQNRLSDVQDYHVLVATTAPQFDITDLSCHDVCPVLCLIPGPDDDGSCVSPGCDTYECANPPTPPAAGDDEKCNARGAGNIVGARSNFFAEDDECMFSSGGRYIDTTEPDFADAFKCAGSVGTNGGTEKPLESMTNALMREGDIGECNAGFLRDDAILVVTLITDEPDQSGITAATAKNALIGAKHGDESAVVVVGIFGDNDLPQPTCQFNNGSDPGPGAAPAPKLRSFLESFGSQGFFGPVCDASYDDVFAEAVEGIAESCENFVPVG